MPRQKQSAPKRRRLDEEQKEKQALEELKAAPVELVEQAAADAFRHAVDYWPVVDGTAPLPGWLDGLGVATTIPTEHFTALQSLHQGIIQQADTHSWSSWSGDPKDPRRRAFGILPDTLGSEESIRQKLDISMPWSTDNRDGERVQNQQATVLLKVLPKGVKEALEWLCQTMIKSVKDPDLRPYLCYDNLIAAQPNLHKGRSLLPIHVDHPLKDGFGIIIVTIGMVGNGTILFQDFGDTRKAKLRVQQGQAYMISGTARNACAHGVLADVEWSQRESLNLRFGVHDLFENRAGLTKISSDSVLKYWELTGDDKFGGIPGIIIRNGKKEEEEDSKPKAQPKNG